MPITPIIHHQIYRRLLHTAFFILKNIFVTEWIPSLFTNFYFFPELDDDYPLPLIFEIKFLNILKTQFGSKTPLELQKLNAFKPLEACGTP